MSLPQLQNLMKRDPEVGRVRDYSRITAILQLHSEHFQGVQRGVRPAVAWA